MIPQLVTAVLLASAINLFAETRFWKTTDGSRTVSGEYVKRDATTVTIRYSSGKEITSPLAKLHPEDLAWLNKNHPLPGVAGAMPAAPMPDKSAVFDQLVFGDTRDQVIKKLKASQFVELTIDETFLGRTGLNGVFRTRKQIGGLDASLYFDWTEANALKELTIQTATVPTGDYQTRLEPSWKEFVALLTTLYGKPIQSGALPNVGSLSDGSFRPSHLWALESGGSVLLGTARDGDKFQLVVRFTQKVIKPVALH